ncbi:transcriptional regulator, y4mF family [Lactococcus lactis subsp. lactis]|nr:transcriptional regulator, y4mF family [Lactococcus lactis subsp. lactis]
MSSTGERIKDARKKKGLTMDKLAHLMGVKSQRTIVNWEKWYNRTQKKNYKKTL